MLRFSHCGLAFLLLLPVAGCSTRNGDAAGSGSGNDCASAGGQCLIGDVVCAVPGPQSCPGGMTPAGIFCCLAQVADCGQPAQTTYSAECDAGPPSCHGTPQVFLAPPDASLPPDDPDASFAAGCTATFPVCDRGGVYSCTCSGGGWTCTF